MKKEEEKEQAQTATMLTQSVTRALAILSCFSDEQPELRGIDFAKKLNLTQSNVSRLLTTMVTLGYVEKDEITGFYRLGTAIISLGGIALNHYEIRKQALPELHELEKGLGLGANLAILNGCHMFYLAHVDSHKSPRMYTLIGRKNPLHCTGIGKVLLAYQESGKVTELLDEAGMAGYTDKTVTQQEQLESQLELVRRRGYATENEELALGRACIAAPVKGRNGKVIGGVSISGPLSEINLPQRESELASILIEATDRISMKMGYITASY
ncbi:helix-turn-helix domain-containing protein [Paenibacillus sp. LMG 31456]|uniref:Helix-turn-helix domain-containing protein n=1 Tax=Paenibacillus foliorum TaxID=2654974 RepID=A0A972K168_9BACL|nr:IclR family transcriptional regulator [Paenibacillus foliorum]NOU96384.1 helix-turn-helix domain-containing protein [Paenibacillus foliorum]